MKAKFLSHSLIFILITVLILAVSASALAGEKTIEELNMTMTFPDDGYVLTRGMDEQDLVFSELHIDQVEMEGYFDDGYIYLIYLDPEPYFEIAITKREYPSSKEISTYAEMSEEQLTEAAEYFIGLEPQQMAELLEIDEEDVPLYNFIGYEIDTEGETNYIVYEYWLALAQGEIFCRQYNTVVGGQAIDIILKSYGQPIRDDVSRIFEGIVDTVAFSQTPDKSSSSGSPSYPLLLIVVAIFSVAAVVVVLLRQKKFKKELAEELESAAKDDEQDKKDKQTKKPAKARSAARTKDAKSNDDYKD